MTPPKKLLIIILILLLIAGIAITVLLFNIEPAPKNLKIIFFDVGQGDSFLVITPSRKTILIDGGPDNTVIYKLGKFLPFWQRKIDLVVISHPHSDHITGLIEVLKRYQVEKFLMTGASHTTYEYEELLSLIKEQNIQVEIVSGTSQFDFDQNTIVKILHPLKNFAGLSVDNLNNTSIVLQLIYGQNKILFTGDLEADAQSEIIDDNLQSQILKVPHQGSADSLNADFLKAVSPEIAIISVGKNDYGHPSPRVVNALKRAGITVAITQDLGDIVIICDLEICRNQN